MSSIHNQDDAFGSIMLLAGMASGWVVNETTGRYGLAWVVGLLVLFSPFLLIGGVFAVEELAAFVKGAKKLRRKRSSPRRARR